jgi:hypothetical protein
MLYFNLFDLALTIVGASLIGSDLGLNVGLGVWLIAQALRRAR